MFEVEKLTRDDLSIFENKQVLLLSGGEGVDLLFKTLLSLNIKVVGYSIITTSAQPTKIQICKKRIRGLRYLDPAGLDVFFEKQSTNNLIIQPVFSNKEELSQIDLWLAQVTKKEFEKSNVAFGQILFSFSSLSNFKRTKSFLCFFSYWINTFRKSIVPAGITSDWKRFCEVSHENAIVICAPNKTADNTLVRTFTDSLQNDIISNKIKSQLYYINVWHRPNGIKCTDALKLHKPFKVITGIREPISQNLSLLYQRLSANFSIADCFYKELFFTYPTPDRKDLASKYKQLALTGLSVQASWNIYMNLYVNKNPDKSYYSGFIQDFIPEFSKYVLDITAYDFNQEKGYTIIKEGDIEIFVYQLEKLNSLVSELSAWVGVPFDKLEKGNVAEDKWIAESYKQAQKEIEITQEYFDKCFDEPYVKHCYSEADIEKFKARWRPHIKKEA